MCAFNRREKGMDFFMRKIFILSAIIFICFGLTGCALNFEKENKEKLAKVEDNREVVIEDMSEDEYLAEEEGFEYSKINFSNIDLGNSYYYIIYGEDEDYNTVWTYETEQTRYTENTVTDYLGSYNEQVVYLIEMEF